MKFRRYLLEIVDQKNGLLVVSYTFVVSSAVGSPWIITVSVGESGHGGVVEGTIVTVGFDFQRDSVAPGQTEFVTSVH